MAKITMENVLCDHKYEEVDANEYTIKIKCNKCGLVNQISQKWQYLSGGKVMTIEGQDE